MYGCAFSVATAAKIRRIFGKLVKLGKEKLLAWDFLRLIL